MEREITLDEYPETIHEYFGLSYAQYLVTPRLLLQSMPIDWQKSFVKLMKEFDDAFEDKYNPPNELEYSVMLKDEKGKLHSILEDPCHDYERGRRIIPLRIKENVNDIRTK